MHNVLYATDANYWMHLYVSLYSLLKNNSASDFTVYILTDETNEEFVYNLSFLYQMGNLADCKIIELDSSIATSYPLGYHFTKAIYYRLFIGRLLPQELKKVLYLDCDTIIDGPLDKLFEKSLDTKVLAAVRDKGSLDEANRLGLPSDKNYFNSGVLLINMQKWRVLKVESKLLAYIERNPNNIKFPDQDALNAVLFNMHINISNEYNFHDWARTLQKEERSEKRPKIIHYVDYPKPWFYSSRHPLKDIYWGYLKETPYCSYREPDRNLKNYFIMIIYYLKIKIKFLLKKCNH